MVHYVFQVEIWNVFFFLINQHPRPSVFFWNIDFIFAAPFSVWLFVPCAEAIVGALSKCTKLNGRQAIDKTHIEPLLRSESHRTSGVKMCWVKNFHTNPLEFLDESWKGHWFWMNVGSCFDFEESEPVFSSCGWYIYLFQSCKKFYVFFPPFKKFSQLQNPRSTIWYSSMRHVKPTSRILRVR